MKLLQKPIHIITVFSIITQLTTALSVVPSSSTNKSTSRKQFLKFASGALTFIASSSTNPTTSPANAAILRNEKCAYGVGDGCDTLAGENDFIKELQRKSAERKELEAKEYVSAYQMKNYPDFFAALNPPKYMVKNKADGSILLFEQAELDELKQKGKIKMESPTAMGGKVTDLTQKPIMVLVD